MGHDGPGHIAIAQEQPTLRALKLFHGKRGAGLSVEFKVRYGPITIVGCTQTADGRLKLIVAEGESIPGETFRIGNTNSRLKFSLDAGGVLRGVVRARPDASRRARRRPRRGRGAQRGAAARARVRAGRMTWNASASSCTSAPSGSTSTASATGPSGPRCSTALSDAGWTNYSLFLRPDGLLIGYLETEDFEAAERGDGGDGREHALAGRDGAVLRAASWRSSGWRRCSTLTELCRDRPRRLERPGGAAGASTAGVMALEDVPPLPEPPRAAAGRAALEPAAPVHGGGRRAARPHARRRRRRHLGRRLRAAGRAQPRARPAVPLPRRAHRGRRARVDGLRRSPASRTCRSTPSTSCWPSDSRRGRRPSAIALVPDLLAYWLCGELANERTNASTTGLLDARTGEWALRADRARSGCRRGRSARWSSPGTLLGRVLAHHELDAPVYTVASHDTASAFAAAPLRDEHAAILSSRHLVAARPRARPARCSRDPALTNERGVDGTIRLLKNVMGLWLEQECARVWDADFPTLHARGARRHRRRADVRPRRRALPARRRHAGADRRGVRARELTPRRDRALDLRLAGAQVPRRAGAPGGRVRARDRARST